MKRRSSPLARALLGTALLGCSTVAAAQNAATIPLAIHWVHNKPDSIILEATDSELAFQEQGRSFTRALPRSSTRSLWAVALRYGNQRPKIVLEISGGLPSLDFNLPYRAYAFCHRNYVLEAERPAQTREEALERMLTANHLLNISDPETQCPQAFRGRLLRARLAQNNYLVRNSTYFALVPEYLTAAQAFAATENGNGAFVAWTNLVETQEREISIGRTYQAQAAAQRVGEFELARDLVSDLAARVEREPEWARAANNVSVDVSRDLVALQRVVASQQGPQ